VVVRMVEWSPLARADDSGGVNDNCGNRITVLAQVATALIAAFTRVPVAGSSRFRQLSHRAPRGNTAGRPAIKAGENLAAYDLHAPDRVVLRLRG